MAVVLLRNMHLERSSFEEYWRVNFRSFAETCDDDAGISGWRTTGLETRLRHFRTYWLPDSPGSLWLDAGCGAGTYTRFLAMHGIRVVGLDYSYTTVVKARTRDRTGSQWAVADLNYLPVRSDRFRGVLCFGVMQALDNAEPALQELVGVAGDNAEVWIDALNRFCLPTLFHELFRELGRRPLHLRYDNPWRLRSAMTHAGLTDVTLFWVPILPARFQRFQWIFETRAIKILFALVPPAAALMSHSFLLRGRKPCIQDE